MQPQRPKTSVDYSMFGTILTAVASSVAVAAGRRSGVLIVDVAKIKTPLIKQGVKFYLEGGESLYGLINKNMPKGGR